MKDFIDFYHFLDPLAGSVLVQRGEKMEYGKTSEKVAKYFHAGHTSNPGESRDWPHVVP